MVDDKEEELSRSAFALFKAKEDEIERRKMEVKDRVQTKLGLAEEATRRLAEIREVSFIFEHFQELGTNIFIFREIFEYFQELEALTDPMRKEISAIRKRVDGINRELKPLGQSCQRKVMSNECVCFDMFINILDRFLAKFLSSMGCCLQEREFKEALEAYNEKNKEKAMFVSKLVEVKHSFLHLCDLCSIIAVVF